MRRTILSSFLAAFAMVVVSLPVRAETTDWPVADRALISDIEAYLNDLTTVRARFSQANADGSYDTGILWLWRPGKARIEYSPPTDILVVADGTWLIYFDAELDQVSHVPIDTGPFRFLLADTVSLEDTVQVRGLGRSGGLVHLTLIDVENPDDGSVTLVFDEGPLQLRQWEVLDPQGFVTVVTLSEEKVGETFERKMFFFPDSARKRDFRVGAHR
jgi:outer membrane lipoprotein-sorting protein